VKSYDGRIAVVTGASRGLGRQLCIDLARRGAVVVGLARDAERLEVLAKEVEGFSPHSETRVCDVGDVDAYAATLANIEHSHGRIDLLINNAAISDRTLAAGAGVDTYGRITDVNYLGPVAGTLAVMPGMLERRSGAVVNVSSDVVRAPSVGHAAYAASKAALSTFTEGLAHEVGPRGVHLHVLYPGWMPTDMGMAGTEGGQSIPRIARRTVEQVSKLTLDRIGQKNIDINAVPIAVMASVLRAVAPRLHARVTVQRH
jgi:short-subunit dehydrogenase